MPTAAIRINHAGRIALNLGTVIGQMQAPLTWLYLTYFFGYLLRVLGYSLEQGASSGPSCDRTNFHFIYHLFCFHWRCDQLSTLV